MDNRCKTEQECINPTTCMRTRECQKAAVPAAPAVQRPVMDPARVREVQAERIARLEALVLLAREFAEEVHAGEWAGDASRRDNLIAAIDAELPPKEPT